MLEDRIYTLNTYYRKIFGEKIYKLSLNPGTTCPNRDGTCGTGGCTFCSAGGSGDFTASPTLSMNEQLEHARSLVRAKGAHKYVAYFQAFTGTYAPVSYLEPLYSSVLSENDVVGLSIGTRPDCIPNYILELLVRLRLRYNKPIFIELGLQTMNESVANACNRGYTNEVFIKTVHRLALADFPVTVHMILGLPQESREEMLQGISAVCSLPISGIKLQQLHILKGTAMEKTFENHPEQFAMMDESCYISTVAQAIALIPSHIAIHRLTGDGPKKLLIAPRYTANKKYMLSAIEKYLIEHDIIQGQALSPKNSFT